MGVTKNRSKAGFGRDRAIQIAEESQVDPSHPHKPIEIRGARDRSGVASKITAQFAQVF